MPPANFLGQPRLEKMEAPNGQDGASPTAPGALESLLPYDENISGSLMPEPDMFPFTANDKVRDTWCYVCGGHVHG